MNHLAHFALAANDPGLITGSFLGDTVKGRLKGHYPANIERGIRLHRHIDSFTDQHHCVSAAWDRLDGRFRRYAGIITDVYFDHLLALHWDEFYQLPLDEFSRCTLNKLLDNKVYLSPRELQIANSMARRNSLAGYTDTDFPKYAFEHLATRLTRTNPLNEAYDECTGLHDQLTEDFLNFYPLLVNYCENWRTNNGDTTDSMGKI